MKKLIAVILCVAIVSPTFALADNKSENSKDKDYRKTEHVLEKMEKYEKKENKKEEYKNDHKEDTKAQKEMNRVIVRLEAAIARVQRLSDRVAERLTKFEAQGVNTISSRAHLVEAKVKLDLARVKVAALKISIAPTVTATSTTATTTPKNKMKELKIAVKGATEIIKEAHNHVVLAISSAKPGYNNGGNATTTPDTTAPLFSGVVVSAVASTSATVFWNTNELATGKLFYGTSTPLTTFVYNGTPSLARTFSLTGLTASTTYKLLLESKDAAGNTATTSSSFVTTN